MNLDIQKIVDNKIQEMDGNETIKTAIEEGVEKLILKSIGDALGDYSLKRSIEQKVSDQVSNVVAAIGFTAYNSFIAEKVKQITEEVCRADIAEKIQKLFNEILIVKRDNIKLSEIFEQYRKWVCETVDEEEKYSLEDFHVKFELDEKYEWYKIELAPKKPDDGYSRYSSDDMISFTLHQKYKEPGVGYISNVYIDGCNVREKLKFRHLSDIEALLINLTYNETPIIIDVESEDDIDDSYDVDI